MMEGDLSDRQDSRFTLPYPGQWQVLMIAPVEFITAQAIAAPDSNLAQVQAAVAANPVPLGAIEADAPAAQVVKCPLVCVITTTPPVEPTEYLPETGQDNLAWQMAFLINGVMALIAGLVLSVLRPWHS
jgi:hypothetical protein